MGLREQAEQDLAFIMEDRVSGFGWDIILTNPEGFTFPPFIGFSTDISQVVDPDTGMYVSGRSASVALRISSLAFAGIVDLPQNVAKSTEKPWLVRFLSISGKPYVFKVTESRPDRALGVIVCMLELYKE